MTKYMKLTTGILGCALAAGLMTFAANKAQAEVIGGTLYSPLKLQMVAQYVNSKGKLAKMSFTEKDVLTGFLNDTTKGDALAVSSRSGDVWIINQHTLVANISQIPNDYLFVKYGTFISATSGKDDSKYAETGVTYVDFYDGGYDAFGTDSANWFETSGIYDYEETTGKVDKKGDFKFSQKYVAKALSGAGFFADVSEDVLPVTGKASYKGSGKLTEIQDSPLNLGAAADFAVLAGSTVANTGETTVTGDLGLSPGSDVTGFPPGTVIGIIHVADTTAAQAQLDLTIAYNDAAGRTLGPVSVAGNLGGMTLPPGLYKSTSSLEISSGDLTLDAQGDEHAVFIFQIASTLTTTSGRQVILAGGAKAANVFWQVGTSAVLGSTSVFKGTIMADQSITMNTGATLEGRALARIAAVTLDSNVITLPAP